MRGMAGPAVAAYRITITCIILFDRSGQISMKEEEMRIFVDLTENAGYLWIPLKIVTRDHDNQI